MKNDYWIDLLVTISLLLLAYFIRVHSFLDMDVAWHVEGARRLLVEHHYLTSFFDDNSPIVFVFFIPVIWLHEFFRFPYVTLIPTYILLNNILSLSLLYVILRKVIISNKFHQKFLYYTCVFILLFLPIINFGQREVIFINFFLPYFFTLIYFTAPKILPKSLLIFCALLASFGVMQNMVYLAPIIIVDLYRWFKYRQAAIFQLFFYLGMISQLLILFFLYSDYFKIILPMVLCYEGAFNSSLSSLLTPATWICFIALFLVLFNLKKLYKEPQIILLGLLTLCTLIIYFIEKKSWFYHLYPALSLALILNTLLLLKFKAILFTKPKRLSLLILFSFAITITIALTTGLKTAQYLISSIKEYQDPQHPWNKWIFYAKKNFENKKLFFFIVYFPPVHMLPIYTNTKVTSPWFNAWFIPFFIKTDKHKPSCLGNDVATDLQIIYKVFLNSVTHTQPDYILVSVPAYKENSLLNQYEDAQFFKPTHLRNLLKNYLLYDRYEGIEIYKRRQ